MTNNEKDLLHLHTPESMTGDRIDTLVRSWELVRNAVATRDAENGRRRAIATRVSSHTNLLGRGAEVITPSVHVPISADVVQSMAQGDMLGGLTASIDGSVQQAYVDAISDEEAKDGQTVDEIRERVQRNSLPVDQLQDLTNEQFALG